jgi:hypothetical protein
MKKPFLLTSIILLIIGLILSFFSATLFAVQADPNDSTWQLSVIGLVNNPSNFTLANIEAMPQTTVFAQLYCVDYPTKVVAEGSWTGVKLWTLLNETGVLSGAIKVAFFATDGYSTDLTIDSAKADNIILAYAKDGAPLKEVLRLIVPGQWGYKWIAQVAKIEIVNYDFTGKWESAGYSDDGITTKSNQLPLITYPSPTVQPTKPPVSPPAPTEETPSASPSIPPITNSTSPLPLAQPKNLTSQNLNLLEATAVISIIIVVISLITIVKKKNSPHRQL